MSTKGSGGKGRRKLRGRGPTPKAQDRHWYAEKYGKGKPKQSNKPKRPKSHTQWVVGRNPVYEALQAGLPVKAAYIVEGADRDDRLRDIFKFAAENSISLLQTTRAELDRMTNGAVHQGVALQLPPYEYADAQDLVAEATLHDSPALLVALNGITDPHNLGAISRSAAAFGAHGVIIPEHRSAQVTAAAWKASAGALARIPVAKVTNLNQIIRTASKAGYVIAGLDGSGDTDISGIPGVDGPLMVVIGSEGDGLSRLTAELCDVLVSIPITDATESLNASVAAGVALYEVSRCRGTIED